MGKISGYPTATPEAGDFVIGTDTSDNNNTKEFPVSDFLAASDLQAVTDVGATTTNAITVTSGVPTVPSSIDYLQVTRLRDSASSYGSQDAVWGQNAAGDNLWVSRFADVPASAVAAGVKGDIAVDASFAYFCIATNTWVRVAVATW